MDNFSRGITIAAILLVLGSSGVPILLDMMKGPFRLDYIVTPLLLLTLIGGLFVVCHAFAPQSYTLTQDTLTVNRAIKPPTFRLADIADVQLLDKAALWTAIRTFGVGGLFGYYGKYWHQHFGHMTLYATRSDNKILITFKDNSKIVVTPDSLDMFDELRNRMRSQLWS